MRLIHWVCLALAACRIDNGRKMASMPATGCAMPAETVFLRDVGGPP